MTSEPLDPEIAALADLVTSMGLPPLSALSPDEARARSDAGDAGVLPGAELQIVRDVRITDAGLMVRIYSPSTEPLSRGIVYAHGGGWTAGTLETLDALCRELAAGAGCVVISVDYSLAPEHPFPAALDDVAQAWQWASATLAAGHLEPGAVLGVGGDSSGGNLAAALVHRRAEPMPAFQLLIYPVLDSDLGRDSYRRHRDAFPLQASSMAWFWDQYVPEPDNRHSTDAAPLHDAMFTGLPPTLIALAGHDPLHDEGQAYAQALRDAGGDVNLIAFDDLPHSFVRFTSASSRARAAQASIIQALRDLMDSNPASITGRTPPQ